MRLNTHHPGGGRPAFDLLDRAGDRARRDGEERLQSVGILTAEVVEVTIIGPNELELDPWVLVAIGSGRNHHVDVDALFVHVADPGIRIPIRAPRGGKSAAHEMLKLPLGALPRTGLAEYAR